MKVFNQTTANRVARAGFAKMTADDYTLFAPVFDVADEWHVAKNDGETTYTIKVTGKSEGEPTYTCNCGFFEENPQFGICKHILLVHEERTIRVQEEIEEEKYLAGVR